MSTTASHQFMLRNNGQQLHALWEHLHVSPLGSCRMAAWELHWPAAAVSQAIKPAACMGTASVRHTPDWAAEESANTGGAAKHGSHKSSPVLHVSDP